MVQERFKPIAADNLLDLRLINQDEPKLVEFLKDLQGNILKGHGRDYAAHIFIAFDKPEQIQRVKRWIASLNITSAKAQFDGAESYRQKRIDAGLFTHIAFSANGYAALDIAGKKQPQGANLQNRPTNLDNGKPFYANAFQQGMKARQSVLLDPCPKEWESEFQLPIDAVVILADDNSKELKIATTKMVEDLKPIATVRTVEYGRTLRRKFQQKPTLHGSVNPKPTANEIELVVEHFGYADGVSQPIFLQKQYEREKELRGIGTWDPAAPLKLALIRDPNGHTKFSFGSFLVFRKLEQNVKGFKIAEAKLGKSLGLPKDLVGAMAVGRFEDGSPVVLKPDDGAWATQKPPAVPNDFDYSGDQRALKCPFHAHIRKSNPRLESVKPGGPFAQSKEEELGHRIARRGITYGGPLSNFDDLNGLPTGGVGLLFMCYQSDIWEQFEFIQRFWCDNPNFLEPGLSEGKHPYYDKTGLDAVIGQKQGNQTDPVIGEVPNPPQNWPSQWNKPTVKPKIPPENQFGQFVTLKGGEYFFSPSISFLKKLPNLPISR